MTLQNNYSGQLVKKVKQQQCLDSKLYFILKLTYRHPILKINKYQILHLDVLQADK